MAAANGASETFYELSLLLTAEPELSAATAERHLSTLQARLGHDALDDVLQRFREIKASGGDLVAAVRTKLIPDARLTHTVKTIVLLWFTGQVDGASGASPSGEADFFEALMWSVIGAHPPAFSDGYFGHWRYPPDTGA